MTVISRRCWRSGRGRRDDRAAARLRVAGQSAATPEQAQGDHHGGRLRLHHRRFGSRRLDRGVSARRAARRPKILVLEAGRGSADLPEAVQVPWRWNELLLTDLDWAYNSAPQPALSNRRIYSAAGRGAGGGSIVYHMMHVRARPADLDNWAYNGCSGWSFEDCLPYYQKLENQLDNTNPTAGKGGPITIVNARDTGNPISQVFLDACVELGYPLVDDFNASAFGCRLAPSRPQGRPARRRAHLLSAAGIGARQRDAGDGRARRPDW